MKWGHGRHRGGFIEHTIDALYGAMERFLYAENTARGGGFLQRIDPRVKVGGLLSLILAVALITRVWAIAAILVVAIALAMASLISLGELAARVWLPTLPFTAVVAIPAIFLTPGHVIWRLPVLDLPVTAQGIHSAARLILRVETAVTLVLLLVLSTPWTHVLKALRIFRVPVVFVVILGMTCRYILLLLETAHELFESRKSRTVGAMTAGERRRIAVANAGVLLGRTFQLSNDVYLAMQSRGFRGEVYLLDDFEMRRWDWAALLSFAGVALLSIWLGR
ncbi:MAG: cobalt ECF transporter T component CbiQ [Acidobacteriia bacterium]|nr:cobalt ECF transporter T component CbiQ [Terriglobia bacterium]